MKERILGPLNKYGISCLISGLFLLVICSFIAFLRFWSQRLRQKPFRHHDYLVLASLLLITLGLIFKVISFASGEGDHVWDVPTDSQRPLLIYFTVSSILWNTASATTRISILLVYIDIFKNLKFRRACYAMIFLSVACFLVNNIVQVLSCTPLWRTWSFADMVACRNMLPRALMAITGDSAFLDFITTIMPMTVLWKMQMPLRRKIGVMLAFGALLLVCCIDIARLVLTSRRDFPDVTRAIAPQDVVLDYDVFLGIIAACIPTILPATKVLFFRYRVGRQLFVYGNLWFQRLPHRVWGMELHHDDAFGAYAYPLRSRGRRFRQKRLGRMLTADMHVPMVVQRLQTANALEGQQKGKQRQINEPNIAELLIHRLPNVLNPRALRFNRQQEQLEEGANISERHQLNFNTMKSLPALPSDSLPELPQPAVRRRGNESVSSFIRFFQQVGWSLATPRASRLHSHTYNRTDASLATVSQADTWDCRSSMFRSDFSGSALDADLGEELNTTPQLSRPMRVWHMP